MRAFEVTNEKAVIPYALEGENQSMVIIFPVKPLLDAFDGGTFTIVNYRHGDTAAYPCSGTLVGDKLHWTITASDIPENPGYGKCQVVYSNGTKIAKSPIFKTICGQSLSNTEDPPEAWQSWVDSVIASAAQVAADKATVAADKTTTQGYTAAALSYRNTAGQYKDTAKTYRDDAYTAKTAAEASATTASQKAADIAGLTASASTGAAGSSASVSVTGGGGTPYNFAFSIPKGDTGATGQQGPRGETGATGPQGPAGPSYDDTEIREELATQSEEIANKQDTLTAGSNITISNNVISATGGMTADEKRKLDALWLVNKGVTYDFETDSTEAYSKSIPTGAFSMAMQSMGGKSEVHDGTIVHANTQSVKIEGKNLINSESVILKSSKYICFDVFNTASTIGGVRDHSFELNSSDTYNVTIDVGGTYGTFGVYGSVDNGNTQVTVSSNGTSQKRTYTVTGKSYFACWIYFTDATAAATVDLTKVKIMIEKNSTATDFKPYHEPVLLNIPNGLKSLTGYGWGVNSNIYNYIDFVNKKYIQRVGIVDLSTLTWGEYGSTETIKQLYTAALDNIAKADAQGLCDTLTYSTAKVLNTWRIASSGAGRTYIRISPDASPTGTLYYELATPIETDITSILAGQDIANEGISVEAGGTITFVGENDSSYHIPIPNSEKYIVKLSEVG